MQVALNIDLPANFQLATEKHQSLDEMVVYSKTVKLNAATAAAWWLGFFVVRLDNLWFM
jgi:hypothetical protein